MVKRMRNFVTSFSSPAYLAIFLYFARKIFRKMAPPAIERPGRYAVILTTAPTSLLVGSFGAATTSSTTSSPAPRCRARPTVPPGGSTRLSACSP